MAATVTDVRGGVALCVRGVAGIACDNDSHSEKKMTAAPNLPGSKKRVAPKDMPANLVVISILRRNQYKSTRENGGPSSSGAKRSIRF